jgi:glyoxylase-like metal-dependent hydrolase (beta-lactamase superfamily II)
MTRGTALGALIAMGACSMAVAAYQQQQTPPPAGAAGAQQPAARVVQVDKLKENLFMLRGGGGNTAVFVISNGVVVVDTKNPGWGQPILDKIKELTDKPVTTIINTHTHGDHVSGNVEFPASVDVVVHENTKASMEKMASPPGMGPAQPPAQTIFQQNNGRGLAKRTFKDRMTIGKGPDQVDLFFFGPGHTNGDAFVVFPALRTMHAGDIFSGKNLPLLDTNNGGSAAAIGETLGKAHSTIKNVEAIITGHSTVMTWADLAEYAQFNRDFFAAVAEGKKAGKSAEEIAAGWTIPAKYTGYAAPQAARLRQNVETALKEIK